MSIGVFTNKKTEPTIGDIFGVLGKKRMLWDKMEVFISKNYAATAELKFYGKRYGWAICYKKAGRALLSLYPQRKYFVIQIVLNEEHIKKTLNLNISPEIKETIRKAHHYWKGRRAFIKVVNNKHLRDAQKVILIVTKPVKNKI